MIFEAEIHQNENGILLLESSPQIERRIVNTGATMVEIRVIDPRDISREQRRKARALTGEIARWSGHEPDYIHEFMKWDFCVKSDTEPFSLADCDMTTARLYISHLIDFCLYHGVPTKQPLYAFVDDIQAYVYQCLAYRKCAVTNTPNADIHHCTGSRVGMGRDRDEIVHVGLVALPLSRELHNECHVSEADFMAKHHLQGIPLDAWLCQRLGMNAVAD